MITGIVTAGAEAVVPITVVDAAGRGHSVRAAVDTGFTGYLTLPLDLIGALDLPWLGREQGILGDGSVGLFDLFTALVVWDGRERLVAVAAAETEPLIGMELLYGYELRVQVIAGGEVQIEPLPREDGAP